MRIDISKRMVLLIMFMTLATLKYLKLNSLIDDLLLLVAGAILGKEALDAVKTKKE